MTTLHQQTLTVCPTCSEKDARIRELEDRVADLERQAHIDLVLIDIRNNWDGPDGMCGCPCAATSNPRGRP